MSALGPLPGLNPGPLQAAHGLIPAPAPPAPAPALGADPTGPAGGGTGGDEQKSIDLLKQMINLAHRYIAVEPDAVDKQTMAKVLSTLTGYLANDQKQQEAAMGTTPAVKFMQKAQ